MSCSLAEIRNCVLTTTNMTDGEQFDRFFGGLKSQIPVEVLKCKGSSFKQSALVALRIDSELY